jgi:hypothetical protein
MKRAILLISLGLLILIVVGLLAATRSNRDVQVLSQPQFVAMVQSNSLAKVRVYYPPQPGQVDGVPVMLHEVRGTFYKTDAASQSRREQAVPKELPFIARVHLSSEVEAKVIAGTNASVVTLNPLVKKASDWFRCYK